MARFRCINCGQPPEGYYFEADRDQCPRCGKQGPAWICKLVDVHLIVMDDQGAIFSSQGRQFIACQRKRDHLALHEFDTFSASGDPRAVTCPSCKGTLWYKQMAALHEEIARKEAVQKMLRQKADCCE